MLVAPEGEDLVENGLQGTPESVFAEPGVNEQGGQQVADSQGGEVHSCEVSLKGHPDAGAANKRVEAGRINRNRLDRPARVSQRAKPSGSSNYDAKTAGI
jgi:hypothetical protein